VAIAFVSVRAKSRTERSREPSEVGNRFYYRRTKNLHILHFPSILAYQHNHFHAMSYKIYCVYILKCSDNTYYTGMTSHLEHRILQHQEGAFQNSYTYTRRPVILQFIAEFTNVWDAIELEKRIKKWSGQKKKALIDGNIEKLKALAACRNLTHYLGSTLSNS